MSNLEAAQTGDRRQALEQARDTLAAAIDAAVKRGDGTVAQLIAQYRATLSEIAELDARAPKPQGSPLDEITARRKARDGAAADHPRPVRRRKSGDG